MINIYNHPAATELGSSFAPLSNPTFSGQITLSTGTAEAPALAFSHNTGLYQPVAGQLSASISGTPIAHVTSTGLSVTGGVCATGAVTAATVALSGLAGGSGPQYNYNYISGAPSQDENYLLAILPPSSGGTHEHILVDGVFGGFFSNEKFPFRLLFANRGGFSVRYETGAIAPAQIRAYTQGDGSIKIYLTVLAGYYATASLNIPLALGGGLVIYPPGGDCSRTHRHAGV